MSDVTNSQVAAAQEDLESALRRCAEYVREADPSIGLEAIKARHKQFDEIWALAIQSVRRVHGIEPTRWALHQMGRKEDTQHLEEKKQRSTEDKTPLIPFDDDIPF